VKGKTRQEKKAESEINSWAVASFHAQTERRKSRARTYSTNHKCAWDSLRVKLGATQKNTRPVDHVGIPTKEEERSSLRKEHRDYKNSESQRVQRGTRVSGSHQTTLKSRQGRLLDQRGGQAHGRSCDSAASKTLKKSRQPPPVKKRRINYAKNV